MATVSITATKNKAARSGTSASRQHRLAARAGIAAGALVAAAVVLPASLANWADVGHPQLAAKIAPWNAPAAADAAAALGTDPRKPEARALVRRALARDLTQVQAIEERALDEALSGNSGRARRLFALSDRLSRRSLPTRLWLIQDAVDRGNVAGALQNFDIALRTTTDAQPILFPVLAKAAADPTLTTRLARALDRPSDWRLMFVEWTLTNLADVGPVADVVAHMRDDQFVRANAIDQRLMEHLVAAREFDAAKLLNRRFGRQANGVADPNFADLGAHYPFGWSLASNGSLGAERSLIGSGAALTYRAAPANSGQVAAQLLVLPPGRYAMATRTATAATGAAPYWSLTCGNQDGAQLARLDAPMAANSTATTTFIVPSTCTGQWLTLSVRPATDSSPQSGAVASVSVSAR